MGKFSAACCHKLDTKKQSSRNFCHFIITGERNYFTHRLLAFFFSFFEGEVHTANIFPHNFSIGLDGRSRLCSISCSLCLHFPRCFLIFQLKFFKHVVVDGMFAVLIDKCLLTLTLIFEMGSPIDTLYEWEWVLRMNLVGWLESLTNVIVRGVRLQSYEWHTSV